jgi:hypothetical protein
VIGLILSCVVQLVYCFTYIPTNSWIYYLVVVLNGVSNCVVDLILVSLPMILIRNLKADYYAYPYATFANLMFFFWSLSKVGHHLLHDFFWIRVILFSTFSYILILVVLFLSCWIFLTLYSRIQKRMDFTIKIKKKKDFTSTGEVKKSSEMKKSTSKDDFKIFNSTGLSPRDEVKKSSEMKKSSSRDEMKKSSSRDEVKISMDVEDSSKLREALFQQQLEEEKKKKQFSWNKFLIKLLKLLIYFPIDLIIFIILVILLLCGSGVGNIVFFYILDGENIFKKNSKVFFLTFLTIVFSISMYFSFPQATRKFLGLFFFKKTRQIFSFAKKVTIASKLTDSYTFTIAKSKLKSTNWEVLNNPHLEEKLCVVVVPDHVVLADEKNRCQIYEYNNSLKNNEDIELYECSNGCLIVNEVENTKQDIFDYRKYLGSKYVSEKFKGRFIDSESFISYFFVFFYGIYFTFFGIPIFYLIFNEGMFNYLTPDLGLFCLL